jgi:hypothetical protein
MLTLADFATASSPQQTQKPISEIVAATRKACVSVRVGLRDGSLVTGSGFLVNANGIVATNFHVVNAATAIQVKLDNGDEYQVSGIFAVDPIKDLALLKMPGFSLPTVALGNSDELKPGKDLIVIGDPKGFERSVSKGILSAIRELDGFRVLQMDASISSGSSGGPILNSDGDVVGMTSFKYVDGDQLNFGIPVNYLRGLLSVDQNLTFDALHPTAEKKSMFGRDKPNPKPGVLVSGYGSADSYGRFRIESLNILAKNNIPIGNVPSEWGSVTGDSIALTFLLDKVKESGANELLYVFSESDYGYWSGGKAEMKLQCYNPKGMLEWEETLRTSNSLSASNAVKRLVGKLEGYVSEHLGEPCLSRAKGEDKDNK